MKINSIRIENFQALRIAQTDLGAVTLFTGRNEAGKSSIADAISMAFLGTSTRVAVKKDFNVLVHLGAESGAIGMALVGGAAKVALPSGRHTLDLAGLNLDLADAAFLLGHLRYVLDMHAFSDMDDSGRRAMLFKMLKLDGGDTVRLRLMAKGCDPDKIDALGHIDGLQAQSAEAAAKARDAKAQWRQITGEAWGSQKAMSWAAIATDVDQNAVSLAREDIASIDRAIEQESKLIGGMEEHARKYVAEKEKYTSLKAKAGRLQGMQEKLKSDLSDLLEWDKKVNDTKALAAGGSESAHMTCPQCHQALVLKGDALIEYTQPDRIADPEAIANLPKYENAQNLLMRSVENDRRDIAAAEAAESLLKEMQAPDHVDGDELVAAKNKLALLRASKKNLEHSLQTMLDQQKEATTASERTEGAKQRHSEILAWSKLADALSPDGLPAEILTDALGIVNSRLAGSASQAGWNPVSIRADMSIRRNHDGMPYSLLSESARWRADAMITEAISHLSGLRMFVLDRIDVLDIPSRMNLINWMDAIATTGDVETVILCGTLKALPSGLPPSVTAHWIENGMLLNEEVVAA